MILVRFRPKMQFERTSTHAQSYPVHSSISTHPKGAPGQKHWPRSRRTPARNLGRPYTIPGRKRAGGSWQTQCKLQKNTNLALSVSGGLTVHGNGRKNVANWQKAKDSSAVLNGLEVWLVEWNEGVDRWGEGKRRRLEASLMLLLFFGVDAEIYCCGWQLFVSKLRCCCSVPFSAVRVRCPCLCGHSKEWKDGLDAGSGDEKGVPETGQEMVR